MYIKYPKKVNKNLFINEFRGEPMIEVCLWIQMMLNKCYEDGVNFKLGLIPEKVKNIREICTKKDFILKYVVWNFIKKNILCVDDKDEEEIMQYMVHNYNAASLPKINQLNTFEYNHNCWIGSIMKDNIIGFQFHPERSVKQGLKFLDYYVN